MCRNANKLKEFKKLTFIYAPRAIESVTVRKRVLNRIFVYSDCASLFVDKKTKHDLKNNLLYFHEEL